LPVSAEEIDSEEKAAKMNDPSMDPKKRMEERAKIEFQNRRKQPGPQKQRFHVNYTKVATTPFSITVPPDGKVTFNLNESGS
jgi:hypothetical protein